MFWKKNALKCYFRYSLLILFFTYFMPSFLLSLDIIHVLFSHHLFFFFFTIFTLFSSLSFPFCFNCRSSFSTEDLIYPPFVLSQAHSLPLVLSFLSIFPATIFFFHISSTYKMADLFTATEGDAHFSFNSRENQNRHFSLNKAIEKQLSLAY